MAAVFSLCVIRWACRATIALPTLTLMLFVSSEVVQTPCKFQPVLVRAKAGIWKVAVYASCATFKDVHDKLFGPFEAKLPGAKMFAITGWRGADPADQEECAKDFRETWDKVKSRIIKKTPTEATSKWLESLDSKLGSEKLRDCYRLAVLQQGRAFVQANSECLRVARDSMKDKLSELYSMSQALQRHSLARVILDFCIELENIAVILRFNTFERPSSSCLPLREARQITAKCQQTFAEECESLRKRSARSVFCQAHVVAIRKKWCWPC